MLLELPEDLRAQGIRDLGVDTGVLDVRVAQVVGHLLNPPPGFHEVHSRGVTERMDGACLGTSCLAVIGEELLHLPLLQRALLTGEEVRPDVSTLTQIAAQEFGCMPPQRLFSS
jgi:hypothetical protein